MILLELCSDIVSRTLSSTLISRLGVQTRAKFALLANCNALMYAQNTALCFCLPRKRRRSGHFCMLHYPPS